MGTRPWLRLSGLPVLLLLWSCGPADTGPPVITAAPGDDLQALLDTVSRPVAIELAPGDYHLEREDYTDPTCGNCEDAAQPVAATRGLRVQGTGVHIRGASARDVAIHTHAGYGILFDGCDQCSLSRVTVTDGVRDPDGRATDAGVVVRESAVTVSDCIIRDNLGDSAVVHAVVVGIAGVAVREGATVTVERCRIERNSWDGIAAYRGARLLAWDNTVDGVDRASGAALGGGRGVGIGLTRDARALVEGNHVTRYWKGIGVFGDAQAEITGNVVEDILTWGIAYWGPAGARPVAWIHDNVVFLTGACGASVDRATPHRGTGRPPPGSDGLDVLGAFGPGELRGNIFVRTGENEAYDSGEPYCHQRAIARHAVPDAFVISENIVHDVRQPGDLPRDSTVSAAGMMRLGEGVLDLVGQRPHLRASRFYQAFEPGGGP